MKYTKLSPAILDSTIWREPDTTRLVWVTMLAMSDWDGNVYAAIPGLADRARVSLDACERALECLLAPDAYSRTPEHDGRRIEKVRGGWRILNLVDYRDTSSTENERARNRDRVRKHRARKRAEGDGNVTRNDETHYVTLRNGMSPHKDLDKDLYKSKALKSSVTCNAAKPLQEPAADLTEEQRRQFEAFERARAALTEPHVESGSPDESEQRQEQERSGPEVTQ